MAGNRSNQTEDHPNNPPSVFGAQQMSPAESAFNSPNNASPTSPRFQNQLQHHVPGQVRQLRPMKSPLYVPAALRPTERPNKNTPLTPPKSLQGSLDSLPDEGHSRVDNTRTPADLVVENDWIANEDLGEVTGEPTREHWKQADPLSSNCDSPKCRRSFNLFTRKHHCRHCGHIFCQEHSSFTIPLDQDARFHPQGIPSRACDACHHHYQKWDTARALRKKSGGNGRDDGSKSDPSAAEGASSGAKTGLVSPGLTGGDSEQTAGSVPRDWAWSTF